MTLEEAKKIYYQYDCSLFSMAREDKEMYAHYKKLNISKEQEEWWKHERLMLLYEKIVQERSFQLFNRMYVLSEGKHNKERLLLLRKALKTIDYSSPQAKLIVAETIIGRKKFSTRSGMIFWAYDIGEKKIATELFYYALDLLNTTELNDKNVYRIDRNINICKLIGAELKLSEM